MEAELRSSGRVVEEDVVDCTVFAPPLAVAGDCILIQAFLHRPEQAEEARAIAEEFDPGTSRRGVRGLELPLPVGCLVTLELDLPGVSVEDAVQRLVWRGRAEAVPFDVELPPDLQRGPLRGQVIVRRDGIPIGRVGFRISIERDDVTRGASVPQGEDPTRFSQAFISYASADRASVLARVQGVAAAGLQYFQDVLTLDPGERYEREIYRHIDECDLFLLFWSKAAKESEWVRREAARALERQTREESKLPEIRPVILGAPPLELPWPELNHLHFNDKLIYLIELSDG